MNRSQIEDMLFDLKDGLLLNVTINSKAIDAYHYALKSYPDRLINYVVKQLRIKWDKRYMPSAMTISELCQSKMAPADERVNDPRILEDEKRSKQEQDAVKYRCRSDIDDLKQHVFNQAPLTDEQLTAKELTDKYIDICDYELNADNLIDEKKKHLNNSYFVIYSQAIEGTLPQITGERKGDVRLNLNKPAKRTPEQEAKERKRYGSLKREEQRELL